MWLVIIKQRYQISLERDVHLHPSLNMKAQEEDGGDKHLRCLGVLTAPVMLSCSWIDVSRPLAFSLFDVSELIQDASRLRAVIRDVGLNKQG